MEDKIISVRYVDTDFWDRECYRNIDTGATYKMVDGKLYTVTAYGEPISPISDSVQIRFLA